MSRYSPTSYFAHLTLRDEKEEQGMSPVTRSQTSSARQAAFRQPQQSSMSRRFQHMPGGGSRAKLALGGSTSGVPASNNPPPE